MDEPILDLSFLSELFLESGNPLTPGSEVTFGFGTDVEVLLGRFGNDSIYASQNVENPPEIDIDILIGDFLDSTPIDTEILFALLDGTNPLLILDRAPIFTEEGEDRFILGDWRSPYYENVGDPAELLLDNPLGLKEFAFIYDFNPFQDTLQLHGSPEDYFVLDIDDLDLSEIFGIDALTPLSGKLIFSERNDLPDLVSFLLLPSDIEIDLSAEYVQFVDSPPPGPFLEEIHQFGTSGYDLTSGIALDSFGNIFVSGFTSGSLSADNSGAQDAFVTKYDPLGNEIWSTQLGSTLDELATELAIDPDGNVFFVGQTLSEEFFSPRKSDSIDGLIAKLDGQDGDLIFGTQIGPEFTDGGFSNGTFSLATDSAGNIYVTGIGVKDTPEDIDFFDFPTTDSTYLYSFTGDGDLRWTSSVGESTELGRGFFDEAYGITIDESRNAVYAIGWTQGLLTPADPSNPFDGTTKYDAWIAKADSDSGQIDWIKQFGSEDDRLEFSWGIDIDSQGNLYGYGWTLGDFGGENAGSYDAWLVKFLPDGTEAWRRQFGTSGDDASYLGGISIDANDNIYLVGHTDSNEFNGINFGLYDSWVTKFDTNGDQQWIRQFGTDRLDVPTDVTVDDNSGYLYISGITDGSLGDVNNGSIDSWLARIDADLGLLQDFQVDGNAVPTINDQFFAIAENSDVGTSVGVVVATDSDTGSAGELSFQIVGGNEEGIFAIDALTGEILVALNEPLDFETSTRFNLDIRVSDAGDTPLRATASVTINLDNVNEAPIATPIPTTMVNEDAASTLINLGTFFDDPEDTSSALTYELVDNTRPNLFSETRIINDVLLLDYGPNQTGQAELIIRATDTDGLAAENTLTVELLPVNDSPVAVNDLFSTGQNQTLTGNVLADNGFGIDRDVDQDVLTTTIVSTTRQGTLVLEADGSFTYAPQPDFSGPDFFLYQVADGNGGVDTAIATITVTETVDEPDPGDIIGEYGSLDTLDQQWQTVTLSNTYINPVVIVSDPTLNGRNPVAIRLRNIEDDTFQLRLQEPNYEDGKHTTESVSYLVIEAGDWVLSDGTRLSAGTHSSNRLTSAGFDAISLTDFNHTPTVLSQVQTIHGSDWVTTRTKDASADGFQLAMQEEEALNGGEHVSETIGWLALEQGIASDGDTLLQGGTTSRIYNHRQSTIRFEQAFDTAPSLIAKLGSHYGGDTANLRLDTITESGFGVRVYEEQSRDAEVWHTDEAVSFLALQGKSGLITGLEV